MAGLASDPAVSWYWRGRRSGVEAHLLEEYASVLRVGGDSRRRAGVRAVQLLRVVRVVRVVHVCLQANEAGDWAVGARSGWV